MNGGAIKGAVAGLICVSFSILSQASVCAPEFGVQLDLGIVTNSSLKEVSGIAASRRNPGVYWVNQDSGDQNRIYAINSNGQHLATVYINNFAARDWEDICIGPGPSNGTWYIYVANIGDNYAQYPTKYVARFAEPLISSSQPAVTSTVNNADILAFQYPDGMRDAETLMVDPLNKDLYVVSKREANVMLYRLPYPQSTASTTTAAYVTTLTNLSWTTAGDISPDGSEILVKNGTYIYHWCRTGTQTVGQAMTAAPITVPYIPELQGEAVCWAANGAGYFTISEGVLPHLFFYNSLADTVSPMVDILTPGADPFITASAPLDVIGVATDNVEVSAMTYSLAGSTSGTGLCSLVGSVLLPAGASWKYYANASAPSASWKTAAFNDSAWPAGTAQLGYGDGDETTVVSYGGNPTNKYMTTYFRKSFVIADTALVTNNLLLNLLRDDGVIVYLNGVEVFRDNMPTGTVTYSTAAILTMDGTNESQFLSVTLPPSVLQDGTNVFAVEMHQRAVTSSDMSFDLSLSHDDDANWCIHALSLSPGTTTLKVKARDAAGNTSTASVNIAYSLNGGAVTFARSDYDVQENTGTLSVAVQRAGGSGGAAGATYRVEAGTATGGTDFTSVTGTVTFADGQTNASFIVWVVDDGLVELPETVIITLYDPYGCTIGTITQVVVTIHEENTDNDWLEDDWEDKYFGYLDHDGSDDSDSDGYWDVDEFRAGTDPMDDDSYLKVPAAACHNGSLSLTWESAPGRTYSILKSCNLCAGYTTAVSHVSATPPMNSWQDEDPAGACAFYIVQLDP